MANLTELLTPWLWLLSLSFASQQWQDSSCTSSGTLPAAEMFLGTISAKEGDTVRGRCLIPAEVPVTIVFFCKDGMEISRLQARRGKLSYDLAYSVAGSSGNISCGYMYRNDNNQVLNSLLSIAWYLKVTGASSRSSTTENPLYQALSFTSQQQPASNCISSSGDLPAPELYLDMSSAYVDDTVLFRCLTPSDAPVSFAFLCKDGKEMTRKPAVPGKLFFDFPHHVSGQSSGNYSCGYQHKGLHNQVRSSHLSITRYLTVTDKTTNSSSRDPETTSPHGLQMILGITIPTTLGLCLVLYLVITKAACHRKNQREQNAKESTDETAAGKLIDASSAGCSNYTGPRGQDMDTKTYESLNSRALEISTYSTLHLQQKSEPAVSASQLNASSIGCFDKMEPADKEVAGEGYEMLNPKSVQNVLYSTLHREQ